MDEIDHIVKALNADLNSTIRLSQVSQEGFGNQAAYSFMGIVHAVSGRQGLHDVIFLKDLGSLIDDPCFFIKKQHLMSAEEFINETGFPFGEYYQNKTGEVCDLSNIIIFRDTTTSQISRLIELNVNIASIRSQKKTLMDLNRALMKCILK